MRISTRFIIGAAALLLSLLPAVARPATTGISFEIVVREKAPDADGFAPVEKKQIQVRENIKKTLFLVNFSLDLLAFQNDSGSVETDLALFTVGPESQTEFRHFRGEPGAVYFLNDIRGKNGTVYRVALTIMAIKELPDATDDCNYDFRTSDVWHFDPSAHFDFYFVPQSLADARWNQLRDFMEINFKQFKEKFSLSFPGKINCFLAPCVLPEVEWDQRMGYAIDPVRFNCFVLYSHDNNTVDPVPAYLTRIYRFLGYAPPLLAEGMAAYFEFPHYYAQKLKKENKLPPLDLLLVSQDYYRLPEFDNLSAASSFVKFLIDTRSADLYITLYKKATDLTLRKSIEDVYGTTLEDLENEWHTLLDTITFSFGQMRYQYQREYYIYRKQGIQTFLGEMEKRMDSYDDSLYVFSEKAWQNYLWGNYQKARENYEFALQLAPRNGPWMIVYANLLLIDSQYDSARTMYDRILEVDSTLKTALHKIGESYYWQGKTDSARKYFVRDLDEDPSQLSRASSAIYLGNMFLAQADTSTAADYYETAVELLQQVFSYGKSHPSHLLRLGMAYRGLALCGKEDLDLAEQYLRQAYFLEAHPVRAVFMSRILTELGRVADLRGERSEAVEYYQQALTFPLPSPYEKLVRSYILEPFNGFGH